MAIVADTFLTFDAIGNREDLQNKIFNIAPVDCPVLKMAGTTKATARLHEWQTQALAAAGANARVEGNQFTAIAVTPTARLGNRCQISDKTAIISNTQDEVEKAGRGSELMYQIGLKRNELKRDMEFILSNNQAPVTGDSSTAPQLRPLCSFYVAGNSNRGAGGSAGTTSAAATDGTQRALTELMLKNVIQAVWTAGGNPRDILCGPFNKGVISSFSGNSTRTSDAKDGKVYASVDVYQSDFGPLKVTPSQFSRDRDVHLLDRSMLAVAYLRKMKLRPQGVNGDAERALINVEYTLEVGHQSAHGVIADLTTTA